MGADIQIMDLRNPTCPTCRTDLALTPDGELDAWVCAQGHGRALTLQEAHGRLQDDEVTELWRRARAARDIVGPRACPMCDRGMSPIELTHDIDEAPGADSDADSLALDVCEPCQVIWFDTGELTSLPADLPNAGPSARETEDIEAITAEFGATYLSAAERRADEDLTSRISRRLRGVGSTTP